MEQIPTQPSPFAQKCELVILQTFQESALWSGQTEASESEIARDEIQEEVEQYSSAAERSVVFQQRLSDYAREFQKDASEIWRKQNPQTSAQRIITPQIIQKWQKISAEHPAKTEKGKLARHVFATLSLVQQMEEKIATLDDPQTIAKQHTFGYAQSNETVPFLEEKKQLPGRFSGGKINATLEDILLANVIVMDGVIPIENDRAHFTKPALRTHSDEAYFNLQKTSGYLSPSIGFRQQIDTASLHGFHGANSGAGHVHLRALDFENPIRRFDPETKKMTLEERGINFHQYFWDGWSKLARELELHTAEPALKKVRHFEHEFATQFAL